MATPRMAGIFFYGIIETFGTTREEASWPVSLPGSFTVLGGTASSGLYVACNVLLSQHFEKRRATASSLVFAAFGFNSIFITPLIEFFRTAYGIRGAFLVYGAILLNAIPAVIVLRSPLWLTNSKVERDATNNEEDKTNAACLLIQPVNGDSVVKATESDCPYTNQFSNFEQSTAPCAKPPDNLSRAGVFPPINSVKLMEANKTVISFTLPTVARQLCTLSFLVYALSFAVTSPATEV
ncbi:monocarboxylate transporter 5-like [Dermacentor variabilis]|uniref:monocarboxylate transporter 5-like n=1 Tax=Dermacentor variabilis TaxID=34621 RepID=UPI003F5B4487